MPGRRVDRGCGAGFRFCRWALVMCVADVRSLAACGSVAGLDGACVDVAGVVVELSLEFLLWLCDDDM
jgi:hypothetical protein